MAYSYRWQYCDMDFLRHCLKKYSLLLEKIPSANHGGNHGNADVRHGISLRLHQTV